MREEKQCGGLLWVKDHEENSEWRLELDRRPGGSPS